MRKVLEPQMKLGEINIGMIKLDLKSRDEIPSILLGIQHIYSNTELKEKVFHILEKIIPKGVNQDLGRPGMHLWKILVLGVIRLGCNIDYDKLQDYANNHIKIREFLLHGKFDDEYYSLDAIKQNIKLFTPDLLDEISVLVVKSGHKLLNKKEDELHGRCDSFVVETDVHYPTDIGLLYDATRKTIELMMQLSSSNVTIEGWRQGNHLIGNIKNQIKQIQKQKESKRGMDSRLKKISNKKKKIQATNKIKEKKNQIIKLHKELLNMVIPIIKRANESIKLAYSHFAKTAEVKYFIEHAERQIDQIERRVLKGEKIPHSEKVFSIFEPHTEWISKGKAGVPQELGIKVSILEDQYQFILNYDVMEKTEDVEITTTIVLDSMIKFNNIKSCSFDKGYYSFENKCFLHNILEEVILPKKGRLNDKEMEEETSLDFISKKKQHSAIESAINCLEHHGLNKCPDHGIDGFKRYVAFSVLSRNLHRLGTFVKKRMIKMEERKAS